MGKWAEDFKNWRGRTQWGLDREIDNTFDQNPRVSDPVAAREAYDMLTGLAPGDMPASSMPTLGGIFIGAKGAQAFPERMQALTAARDMEKAKVNPDEIWRQTFWGRGPLDQQWRTELDDTASVWSPKAPMTDVEKASLSIYADALKLREFLARGMSPTVAEGAFKQQYGRFPAPDAVIEAQYSHPDFLKERAGVAEGIIANRANPTLTTHFTHPELLQAYPDMAKMPAEVKPAMVMDNSLGWMYPRQPFKPYGEMAISDSIAFDPDKGKSTVLHELDHWVQGDEGFVPGGSPGYWPGDPDAYNKYLRLGGEAQSRLTQARRGMTAAQRQDSYPWPKGVISDDRGNAFSLSDLLTPPVGGYKIPPPN